MGKVSENTAAKIFVMPRRFVFIKDGRIHSLDGLRAISILMVIIGHAAGTVGAPTVLDPLHSLGNYGVRFFFVISGFLITHLLLTELEKTETISLRGFYYRRVLRIFPAYYAYILVGVVLGTWGAVDIKSGDVFHAITYTMNYHEERGWHFNHTWSLAVEEQFYLLWPFALLFLLPRRAHKALIGIVFIVPIVRFVMWYQLDASPSAMTRQFQAVSDALALGCLLAFWFRNTQIESLLRAINRGLFWFVALVALIASAGCFIVSKGLFYTLGQSLANIGAAIVIYLCLTQSKGIMFSLLNSKVAIYVGAMSYSLYLWQEPFLNSYEVHFMQSFPVNLFLTFLAASASYYLIERPVLKLKK